MSKFSNRKTEIIEYLKPLFITFNLENDKYILGDIGSSLYNSVENAVILICKHQIQSLYIFTEVKKYLVGKIYRAELINNKIMPKFSQNCQSIAESIGKEYGLSGASVIKYDLFSRAIDRLEKGNNISVNNILRGVEKISVENIIQLSKMQDEDIKYLKFLFKENFHKLSGYIIAKENMFEADSLPTLRSTNGEALIKQMPKHDPDAMITSLSFTVPSWINSLKKSISASDLSLISTEAKTALQYQLIDLNRIITKILINLGEYLNE